MSTLRAKNRSEITSPILIKDLTPLVDEVENMEMQNKVFDSVRRYGLIEPLAVLSLPEMLRVDKGCNRLRAAQELGYTHIDCNVYDDWDSLFKASEVQRKRSKAWRDTK